MKTTQETKFTKSIVKAIADRAKSSDVFNAMCHVFALRERTRQQITVSSLTLKMEKEGFKYTAKDYARELQFLADLGLGKMELKNGVPKVLSKITVNLQSIGKIAFGQAADLELNYIQKRNMPAPKQQQTTVKAPTVNNTQTAILQVGDRKLTLHLSSDEILQLIFNKSKSLEI